MKYGLSYFAKVRINKIYGYLRCWPVLFVSIREDEKGDRVSFNITRQFRLYDHNEFFQLSLSLIYKPLYLAHNYMKTNANIFLKILFDKCNFTHYNSYDRQL